MRGKHAGAATAGFLDVACVRCAVGAEKKSRVFAGRRSDEGFAIALALQQRQAIQVRTQAAFEHCAAVQQQVLWRQRRGNARALRAHELDANSSRNVFKDNAQARKPPHQLGQLALDEYGLAVIGIDPGGRRLAVKLKHDIELFHAREHGVAARERSDAGIGMGRGAGRIVLDAADNAARFRPVDLGWLRVVGQVQRHQGLEAGPGRQCCEDAFPIAPRGLDGCNGWLEIGHYDGAAELPGAEPDHGRERLAVAQVQVPVIRPSDCQCVRLARQRNATLTRGHCS